MGCDHQRLGWSWEKMQGFSARSRFTATPWPLPSDFHTVVQHPQIAFRDPHLQGCRIERNTLNQPRVWSGILDSEPVPIRERHSEIPKTVACMIDRALASSPKCAERGNSRTRKTALLGYHGDVGYALRPNAASGRNQRQHRNPNRGSLGSTDHRWIMLHCVRERHEGYCMYPG
jgi:hypothetical protein